MPADAHEPVLVAAPAAVDRAGWLRLVLVERTADATPPELGHTPLLGPVPAGQPVEVACTASDPSGIAGVWLHYRIAGAGLWRTVEMVADHGIWRASIPGSHVLLAGLDYYIEARDAGVLENVTLDPPGGADDPYHVEVVDSVTEVTPFEARTGLSQGRLPWANPPVTESGQVVVLGSSEPGWCYDLEVGDRVELTQPCDVTAVDIIRTRLRLRVLDGLPAGLAWEVSILIDGDQVARTTCGPGRERLLTDLAANVSKLAGVHYVGLRLELVEA